MVNKVSFSMSKRLDAFCCVGRHGTRGRERPQGKRLSTTGNPEPFWEPSEWRMDGPTE